MTKHVPGRDCAWSPCPTCGHVTEVELRRAMTHEQFLASLDARLDRLEALVVRALCRCDGRARRLDCPVHGDGVVREVLGFTRMGSLGRP